MTQTQTSRLVDRVLAYVRTFEGYSAAHYRSALGITRDQFHSVARHNLRVYKSPSGAWTYYLKNSDNYPQS